MFKLLMRYIYIQSSKALTNWYVFHMYSTFQTSPCMYNCPKWRQEVGPCIRQSLCMNTPEKSTQQLPSAIGTAWEDTAVSSAGDSTDPSRALTLEGGSGPCTGTSKIKIKMQ